MSRALFIATLVATLFTTPVLAASPSSGNFGIGLGGGTGTTGLSLKYYMSDAAALQGVIGLWGIGRHDYEAFGISGDYLFEMPAFVTSEVVNLGWNIGPGLWLGAWNDPHWDDSDWNHSNGVFFGAAGVLGLEFLFQPIPLDIVLEYRPALMIVPGLDMDLVSFDGHIRFYL